MALLAKNETTNRLAKTSAGRLLSQDFDDPTPPVAGDNYFQTAEGDQFFTAEGDRIEYTP